MLNSPYPVWRPCVQNIPNSKAVGVRLGLLVLLVTFHTDSEEDSSLNWPSFYTLFQFSVTCQKLLSNVFLAVSNFASRNVAVKYTTFGMFLRRIDFLFGNVEGCSTDCFSGELLFHGGLR